MAARQRRNPNHISLSINYKGTYISRTFKIEKDTSLRALVERVVKLLNVVFRIFPQL